MNICPISYLEIPDTSRYSERGLRYLSSHIKKLVDFNYTAEEQRLEAVKRAGKISLQGVQPKLSVRLNIKEGCFEPVDKFGHYIIKPQNPLFPELPENEDVTMRLAKLAGLSCPLHGLVYCKDGSFSYFIRRFDRIGKKKKLHVEDFAQLSGKNRDTKYSSSMEKAAQVINRYCTFPAVEKIRFFNMTLFCLLVGNEDMHLKNFSLIYREGRAELSDCYDMVNSTIVLNSPDCEELALPLNGKKRNLMPNDVFGYFAEQRLGIRRVVLEKTADTFRRIIPAWKKLIHKCFLSHEMKNRYEALIEERAKRFL